MNVQDWTVIVVEDTYDDVQLASAILTYYGAHVKVASNGRECLNLLQDIEPKFIITDLSMPEMDGWEMLKWVRNTEKTKHIPVIAMTAYGSVDVAHDAMNAGFDAYVTKPLSPHTFLDYIEKAVS